MADLSFFNFIHIGEFVNRLLSSIYVFFVSDYNTVYDFLFNGETLHVITILEGTGFEVSGFYDIVMPSIPVFDWLADTLVAPLFTLLFFNATTVNLPFVFNVLILCGNIIFVLFIGDIFLKLLSFVGGIIGKIPTR